MTLVNSQNDINCKYQQGKRGCYNRTYSFKTIRKNYEQLLSLTTQIKEKFLERYKLPKTTQEETGNMNIPMLLKKNL